MAVRAQINPRQIGWLKGGVFLLSLLPLSRLVWLGLEDGLGANPVEALSHATGDWTLRFLLITLAVTPLRRLTGWQPLLRFRRMLGLFAFFYGSLHLLTYVWLDQWFDGSAILEDLVLRSYITAGMGAFLLMAPLAATSTRGMMRRLGPRWQQLHRSVYLVGVLGVVHYLWQAKTDLTAPLIYSAILVVLLLARVRWRPAGARAAGGVRGQGGGRPQSVSEASLS